MNDDFRLLQEFRSNVRAPDDETVERIYRYATSPSRRFAWPRPRQIPASRRTKVAAALAAAALTAGVGATMATVGGSAPSPSAKAQAAEVTSVLAQVQSAFGDGRLLSATPSGANLTVSLANSDPIAMRVGTFEAQVLAYAANAQLQSDGQPPISLVSYVDATGQPIEGAALADPVGNLPAAPALASGDCEAAAKNATSAPSPLVVVSARTLPYAGGTCVVKLQASDVAAFAASVGDDLYSVQSAVPNAGAHPVLIEVQDSSGSPLVISTWVPGIAGQGQGGSWVKSGLNTSLTHW